MASVRVKVNDLGFKITKEKLRRVGPHLLNEAVKLGIREAKENAPVKTGDLRASIRLVTKRRTSAVYGTNKPYAAAQEYGSQPRVIVPRRARALRFNWDKMGGIVYYKRVNHPGNRGKFYMARSAETVRKALPKLLKKAMRRAGL